MAEHTPTPWNFSPWHIEEGPPAVRAPAGHLVTTTASDADAEFIVKAVNAHDALVKALQKVRAYNVDIADGRINYRPMDHIQVIDEALSHLVGRTRHD